MNNENLNLPFDVHGMARTDDPETSHQAAKSFDANGLIIRIWEVMARYGEDGCTADDVCDHLPSVLSHSITPRFKQMLERGMVELTGEKRKGHRGRDQLVRRALSPPWIQQKKSPEPKDDRTFKPETIIAEKNERIEELEAVEKAITGRLERRLQDVRNRDKRIAELEIEPAHLLQCIKDHKKRIEELEAKLNRGITACDEVINQDRWECPMPAQWRSEFLVAETIKQALEDFEELTDSDYSEWVDVAGKQRIEELEAENKELRDMEYKWGVRTCSKSHPHASWQMKGKTPKECPFCRTKELEARLQRVRDLPQRWRDHCLKTTEEYTDVRGCADELQAALEKDDGR